MPDRELASARKRLKTENRRGDQSFFKEGEADPGSFNSPVRTAARS
jgi:hypothetical protein